MANSFSFLPRGGSEMADLVKHHDWQATPLGVPETWPQSLRTTLSIMLHSKFPMFLFWGADSICFYNDAYRPSLGNNGKHPAALGSKGIEVWPEIWDFIGPLIADVRNGEEAKWIVDELLPIYRNGQMEDVYWTFCYSPVIEEAGDIAGVIVVCSETTHQVYTEIKLKEYDQRFENLVRGASVGVVVLVGEEMRVDIANEVYACLIHRKASELIGKPLFSVIPEVADPYLGLLNDVRTTGVPLHLYETPYYVQVDGEKKEGFVNVVYQPYRDIKGDIIGVLALCNDVTEQVVLRRKIEETELKARLAIESADLGTYEVNLVTDEIKTSDRFNEIWGVKAGEPRFAIKRLLHPDDRATRLMAHEQALVTGLLAYEARVVRESGVIRWIKARGKVLYNEEGKAQTLLGVIQDITEQKEFAEQLTTLVKVRTLELERSNDDLLQFAHVASHDLKEPVRKIKTFAHRLQDDAQNLLPPKSQGYIDKIQSATDRMYQMIEGVLAYSEINTPGQSIEAVDLNTVITNIEADLEIAIAQKGALIRKSGLPVIDGAAVLIHQLFYNLINNALKFSKPDAMPIINIEAATAMENEMPVAVIEIADNGIGFAQEYATKIFSTFTRLHSKDEFDGTGLGLALCKKIVERHHGSIEAEGTLGIGAIFTVKLPVKQIGKI